MWCSVAAHPGKPQDPKTPWALDECAFCGTRRTVSSWVSWSRILLPIVITLVAGGLGAAATALARDATTRDRVDVLDERRLEAVDERRMIASDLVDANRETVRVRLEIAEQFRQVSASLARIEARLDAQERPSRARVEP